jgi:hypothetical protein
MWPGVEENIRAVGNLEAQIVMKFELSRVINLLKPSGNFTYDQV